MAEEFIKAKEREKVMEAAEHAKGMRELNDEMAEYLQYAKPGTSIIDEMKHAFEG